MALIFVLGASFDNGCTMAQNTKESRVHTTYVTKAETSLGFSTDVTLISGLYRKTLCSACFKTLFWYN